MFGECNNANNCLKVLRLCYFFPFVQRTISSTDLDNWKSSAATKKQTELAGAAAAGGIMTNAKTFPGFYDLNVAPAKRTTKRRTKS